LAVSFDRTPWSAPSIHSRVHYLQDVEWGAMVPAMGPTIGDTEITLTVSSVHDSPFLRARMVALSGDGGTVEATVQIVDQHDPSESPQLLLTAPEWPDAAECAVEVAFDSQTWLRLPCSYSYYPPPVVDRLSVLCMPFNVPTSLSLYGSELFDPPALQTGTTPALNLRFVFQSESEEESEEVVLPGTYRILGVQQEVVCEVPELPQLGLYEVSVSFNGGQDYSPAPKPFRAYGPLEAVRTVPSCGPVAGGTQVKVTGRGIFDAETPFVRLEAGERLLFCPGKSEAGSSADKGAVVFVTPAWREPAEIPEDGVEADAEAEAPPPSVDTALALALNGKNFQPTAKPFVFYEAPTAISAVAPNAATLGEETPTMFTLTAEGLYTSPELCVKLEWAVADGSEDPPVTLVVPVEATQNEEGATVLTFTVPEAVEGEASLKVSPNGQQYVETELKITFSPAA